MKKKTTIMLALIPLIAFMTVPVATVHAFANPLNHVFLGVACSTEYGVTIVTITFAGHSVSVTCNAALGPETSSASTCVLVSHPMKFAALVLVDGDSQTQTGKFGATQGDISGLLVGSYSVYDSGSWAIAVPCED